MRGLKLFHSFVLMCFVGLLSAQNTAEVLVKVLDADSRYPVSYATIRIGYTNQGLIANEDGSFRLPVSYVDENQILVISSIGYETIEFNTGLLTPGKVNNIPLKPKVEALDAVQITTKTKSNGKSNDFLYAEKIVRQALYSIQFNYPSDPYSYVSYYRDYQIVDGAYKNLNEGIIETFDVGMKWPKSQGFDVKSALLYYQTNTKFEVDSVLLKSAYGSDKYMSNTGEIFIATPLKNELELLKIHNPIRIFDRSTFSFIYRITKDFIKNHRFRVKQVVYDNNEALFEIEFVTNTTGEFKYKGGGRIYIAKKNYAIHRLDYGVYFNKGHHSNSNPFAGKTVRIEDDFETSKVSFELDKEDYRFEVSINYLKRDNMMYPSYITFNNRFEYVFPAALQVKGLTFDRNEKAFFIEFDKTVDPKSINRKSNYKFTYKNRKMIVKDVKLHDDNVIKVQVVWKALKEGEALNFEDFQYELKRIKDTDGGTIHETKTLVGYQYRELFSQEIKQTITEQTGLKMIDPKKYLYESPVNNTNIDIKKYWVNSPLKNF